MEGDGNDKFIVKDSGERQQFETGAQRDTQTGKPRYDLIPHSPLKRVAMLYAKGAVKYDEWNWARGMPFSRYLASLKRHVEQFVEGDTAEDHLAAVIFNAMAIMHFQDIGATWLDDIKSRIPIPVPPQPVSPEGLVVPTACRPPPTFPPNPLDGLRPVFRSAIVTSAGGLSGCNSTT